jgi:hypothetical protein
MKNEISKQIFDHLEFLGYETEDMSNDKLEYDDFSGRHQYRSNLVFRVSSAGIVNISTLYYIPEPADFFGFYEALNKVNAKTYFSKWFYRKNDDGRSVMVIENTCYGYDKARFGIIIQVMEDEISLSLNQFRNPAPIIAPKPKKRATKNKK